MKKTPSRWFRDISIKRKLFFIVGLMALLIALELCLLVFTIRTLSATRASVAGEGLWSKAQKDALYNLRRYAYSANESYYQSYLENMKVPEGDRMARLELEKEDPDLDIARKGFIQGKNHKDDIDGLISLFKRFRHNAYIDQAIKNWTMGDSLLLQLHVEAEKLHLLNATKTADSASVKRFVDKIDLLNKYLNISSEQFSSILGEGSRWLEGLILKILFLVALTVEFTGMLLTISLSVTISKGINEITRVAAKVAKGDLSERSAIYANDEMGALANSFNLMVDELDRKLETLKQVEDTLRKQKDLYETLVTAQGEMGQGVSISENSKIVYANEAFCKLYGYSLEEVLSMSSFEDVIIEEERERLSSRLYNKVVNGELFDTGETTVRKKDGKLMDIEYSLHIVRRDRKTQVISIIRDITARKKAESKFRALLESAPDAMIIIENTGKIQLVNAQTEKLFGYRREDIIGKEVDLLLIEREENNERTFSDMMSGEMSTGYEFIGKRSDGETFPVEISLSPLETEEGRLLLAAIRDVTEKKLAAQKLKDYATRLEESNKELEQFAYIASHDLREPLRTITSFVQILQARYKDQLNEEANEFIEFTVQGTNRMNRLISDLLQYSRVGRQEPGFEQIDCNKIIENVLVNLRDNIQTNKAKITCDPLPTIIANELMLIQLFQNLISNAMKFHGPEPPDIHITCVKKEDEWLFSVKDNGIGIDKKFSEKIFIIFQRLHAGTTFEGTGIGLAICKKIVERHGGKIWFDSEIGKGTTFYFTIKEKPNTTEI
jgi:PAS domain S-box-containing protein